MSVLQLTITLLFYVTIVYSSIENDVSTNAKISFTGYQSNSNNPVQSDFPEVPYLSSRPNTAIGFTGGGSRAYIAAIGYLAGLSELDLIKKIRYIGGISGGSWASTTYIYAQNNIPDTEFLGPIVNPSDLTYAGLKEMDPSCARAFAALNFTQISFDVYWNGTVKSVADAWTWTVNKVYHEPAGIKAGSYFSWNTDTVSDIKARNPDTLGSSSFIIPSNEDKPFLIIGTTNNGPTAGGLYDEKTHNFTMLEITPLYIGQFKKQSVAYKYNYGTTHYRTVGGAIEPFAFSKEGTDAPSVGLASSHTKGTFSIPLPSHVFDISDAASLSSYATGTDVESLKLGEAEKFGMKFNYWSPSDLLPSGAETFFADGGSYQNIPLISFLQRRVEKIILFIDDSDPLQPSDKWDVTANTTYDNQVADTLSSFFGVDVANPAWYIERSYSYAKNQVYSYEDYVRVIQGLQEAQAKGNGIIGTFELTTIANDWWGIPAGITSQVTIVYLGRLASWEAQLSAEMKSLLVPSDPSDAADLSIDINSGPFKGFPHYQTTGGDIPYFRANALADLAGWTIRQNAELFQSILS